MDVEKKTNQEKVVIENGVAVMWVAGKSEVGAVAGAITHALDEAKSVELRSIGAGATNQAIKAIAKARGFIATTGKDLITRPGFGETVIDGETRTVLLLICTVI